MAVDTPVLERRTEERTSSSRYAVPSRIDFTAEEEHNARIRDTYARLINPNNRIEDVFVERQAKAAARPEIEAAEEVSVRPYLVENARADADIFRADSAINARSAEQTVVEDMAPVYEEEDEDLRPTPTTIQYQTIGAKSEENVVASSTDKRAFVFGKKEKIIVAVFVAVVVALLTLVIVNSAVIANLNTEIAQVQEQIITVKGSLAGVNSQFVDILNGAVNR